MSDASTAARQWADAMGKNIFMLYDTESLKKLSIDELVGGIESLRALNRELLEDHLNLSNILQTSGDTLKEHLQEKKKGHCPTPGAAERLRFFIQREESMVTISKDVNILNQKLLEQAHDCHVLKNAYSEVVRKFAELTLIHNQAEKRHGEKMRIMYDRKTESDKKVEELKARVEELKNSAGSEARLRTSSAQLAKDHSLLKEAVDKAVKEAVGKAVDRVDGSATSGGASVEEELRQLNKTLQEQKDIADMRLAEKERQLQTAYTDMEQRRVRRETGYAQRVAAPSLHMIPPIPTPSREGDPSEYNVEWIHSRERLLTASSEAMNIGTDDASRKAYIMGQILEFKEIASARQMIDDANIRIQACEQFVLKAEERFAEAEALSRTAYEQMDAAEAKELRVKHLQTRTIELQDTVPMERLVCAQQEAIARAEHLTHQINAAERRAIEACARNAKFHLTAKNTVAAIKFYRDAIVDLIHDCHRHLLSYRSKQLDDRNECMQALLTFFASMERLQIPLRDDSE